LRGNGIGLLGKGAGNSLHLVGSYDSHRHDSRRPPYNSASALLSPDPPVWVG
jgi:hypothetical protein